MLGLFPLKGKDSHPKTQSGAVAGAKQAEAVRPQAPAADRIGGRTTPQVHPVDNLRCAAREPMTSSEQAGAHQERVRERRRADVPETAGRSATSRATVATCTAVEIDAELCKACGICVGLCPTDVLIGGRHGASEVAHPEQCTGCRVCEIHCPEFAITVRRAAGRTRSGPKGDDG
jgi:2-oxoglutarate ferredoxin oxidoreductase subunit delta